jgi:hypothetical protein
MDILLLKRLLATVFAFLLLMSPSYAQTSQSQQPPSNSDYQGVEEVVVGLGVVCAILGCFSGSSGGSAASNVDNQYPRPQSDDGSTESPSDTGRSYGLYGDCPQSGAGYGC